MTEEDKAWYHCGRCGSLFRSAPGDPQDRVCAHCGRDPSLGPEAPPTRHVNPTPVDPSQPPAPQSDRNLDRREGRPQKQNRVVAKLIIGWLFTMAVVVVAVRLISPEIKKQGTVATWRETSLKGSSGDETVVHLEQAMPFCRKTLAGFIQASTPEERNQFVLDPVNTAGRMARFYSLNSLTRIDPRTLQHKANSLLKLPTGQAIESRWETPDGIILDAVFVHQNDEWRLDWDHFVRYQEYPWGPFLAGEGPAECEFRLMVRRRLARDGSESNQLDLVFYPPRFGRPESITAPSVEVIIQRESENGKLLTAGFKQHDSHVALFGSTLPDLDPEGLLRVRVKLRRLSAAADADTDKKFELVKVIACHWLATTDPGVKPAASPAPAPADAEAAAPAASP